MKEPMTHHTPFPRAAGNHPVLLVRLHREIVHSMSAHDKQRWATVVRGSRMSALPEIDAYRRDSSRVTAPCNLR